MQEKQFNILIEKLEEIRCGIIDVETVAELPKPSNLDASLFREIFFEGLEKKTGWGRNEIKNLFDEAAETLNPRSN